MRVNFLPGSYCPSLHHCSTAGQAAQSMDTILHFATSLPDTSTLLLHTALLGTTKSIHSFLMVSSRGNKTEMSNVVMNFTLYSVGFETLLKALKQMSS